MIELLICALAVVGVIAAIFADRYIEWRAWDRERRFKRCILVSLWRYREEILRMGQALATVGVTAREASAAFSSFGRALGRVR